MNLKEICRSWYWNNPERTALVWEILKFVRRRETGFRGKDITKRFLKIGNYGFLLGAIKARFVECENPAWDFFASNNYLKFCDDDGKPLNISKPENYIPYGWDFVLDFDSKQKTIEKRVEESFAEASKAVEYLLDKKCAFSLTFSGDKGIKITLPWEILKPYFEPSEQNEISKKLGAFFIEECSEPNKKTKKKTFKTLDPIVWGKKWFTRVPLSLHPESGLVALPLTPHGFNQFTSDQADPRYLIESGFKIRNSVSITKGDFSQIYPIFKEKMQISKYDEKKQSERQKQVERMENIKRDFGTLPADKRKELLEVLRK